MPSMYAGTIWRSRSRLLARVTRKPIVHEINGPHLDIAVTYPWIRPFHGLLNWMQRVQYRWADALVAVTPQLAALVAFRRLHEPDRSCSERCKSRLLQSWSFEAYRSAGALRGVLRWLCSLARHRYNA